MSVTGIYESLDKSAFVHTSESCSTDFMSHWQTWLVKLHPTNVRLYQFWCTSYSKTKRHITSEQHQRLQPNKHCCHQCAATMGQSLQHEGTWNATVLHCDSNVSVSLKKFGCELARQEFTMYEWHFCPGLFYFSPQLETVLLQYR